MYHDTFETKQQIVSDIESLLDSVVADDDQIIAIAKKIGAEGLCQVLDELGGQKPHIPMTKSFRDKLARIERDELIRKEFDPGHDTWYRDLAEKYSYYKGLSGLSEKQVRNIVHSDRKVSARKPENYKPVKLHHVLHEKLAEEACVRNTTMHGVLDVIVELALEDERIDEELTKKFGKQTSL